MVVGRIAMLGFAAVILVLAVGCPAVSASAAATALVPDAGASSAVSEELRLQQHTADLMTQILTAVSSKQDDSTLFGRLCDLVNDAESAVLGLTNTEEKDAEFHIARLRAELDETNANITSVRGEHNVTKRELSVLRGQHSPLPEQLADAKSRESELMRQKDLLASECSQDLDGQQVRVDSIKTDMQVLDQTISHLAKLAKIGAPASSPTDARSSFLEVEAETAKCDRATLAAKAAGPVLQCQNGITVPATAKSGTISTLPPGEGMNYQQSRTCMFKIQADGADVLDKAELELFALDAAEGEDYVTVYDGPTVDESAVLARFSGRTLPPVVRSRRFNSMTVVFTDSAGKTASPGFMANYRVLKIPLDKSSSLNECAEFGGTPIVLTGKSGFISEDARPEYAEAVQRNAGTSYEGPLKCKWLIQALPEQRVRLHFTYLETRPRTDFVSVYDGAGMASEVVLQQSGVGTPKDVESTGPALFVTYNADFTATGKGFHLSWCILGETCPDMSLPELPPPVPVTPPPTPEVNETAPEVVPAPSQPNDPTPALQPPPYPAVSPEEEPSGSLLLQVDEGASGAEDSSPSNTQALQQALVGLGGDTAAGSGKWTDECGDAVDEVSLEGIGVDTDPVKRLLEKLKFELHRSLNYEHDTTNLTNRHCANETRALDKDIEDLQLTILKLSKGMSELDIKIQELEAKNVTLTVRLQSLREWAADLVQQIKARKEQVSTRTESQQSQVKTLQAMREIITQLGSHTCMRVATLETAFTETPGKLCVGELLDTTVDASEPEGCKAVCSEAISCAGFSFLKGEGCKLYSSLVSDTPCPDDQPSTCSCFRVLK